MGVNRVSDSLAHSKRPCTLCDRWVLAAFPFVPRSSLSARYPAARPPGHRLATTEPTARYRPANPLPSADSRRNRMTMPHTSLATLQVRKKGARQLLAASRVHGGRHTPQPKPTPRAPHIRERNVRRMLRCRLPLSVRLCHNIKLIFRAYELLHIDIHLFLSKRSLL